MRRSSKAMITAEVIILSSSPVSAITTTPPWKHADLHSSPLVSSSRFFQHTTASSSLLPARESFATGFTAASVLLRRWKEHTEETTPTHFKTFQKTSLQGVGGTTESQKRLEKRKSKENEVVDEQMRAELPEKSTQSPEDIAEGNIDFLVEQATLPRGPTEESQARKPTRGVQTKITRGRLSKPGQQKDGKGHISDKDICGASEIANGKLQAKVVSNARARGVLEPLGLEQSIRRKKSWTPPQMDPEIDDSPPLPNLSQTASVSEPSTQVRQESFGALLSNFALARSPSPLRSTIKITDGSHATKKRRVELFNTLAPGSGAGKATNPTKATIKVATKTLLSIKKKSTGKPKAPKRCKTVTDFATTAYREQNPTMEDAIGDSNSPWEAKHEAVIDCQLPSGKLATATPHFKPPAEVIKTILDQELHFGTFTQLVGDDSSQAAHLDSLSSKDAADLGPQPEMIDIMEPEPSIDAPNGLSTTFAPSPDWPNDSEPDLTDSGWVDLTQTPGVSRAETRKAFPGDHVIGDALVIDEEEHQSTLRNAHRHPDLARNLPSVPSESANLLAASTRIEDPAETSAETLSGPTSMATSQSIRKAKKQTTTKAGKKSATKTKSALTEKPHYPGFTTAELGVTLTNFGFKPIKNRDNMIALLEQCWQGQVKMAQLQAKEDDNPKEQNTSTISADPEPGQSQPIVAAPAPKPARKRGTKAAQDDKPPPGAKPTSRSTAAKTLLPARTEFISPISASAPTSEPATTKSTKSITTTTSTNTATLLADITAAILACPPSHDPSHPSWHEKMLLYDPIVLEDLAAWLNAEGLARVHVDEEVDAGLVREWCEGRGVCCLWRESLRGGTRVRY